MNVLNTAYTEVRTGIDYNTAIRKALSQMAKNGVKVVSYKQKSGKVINYGIESCVRRDVLTAVVQATNRASTNFCKEAGYEYYVVSHHLGARVTNTHDYKDHSWWQGKVYKIDGSTEEYPNFQDTCNEGDVQGFGGANCRHLKFGYIPGVSVLPKPISEEENAKQYQAEQNKRSYERKIRELKRQCGSAKASNDTEEYKKYKEKLVSVDNEYNEFLKNNGLKRSYSREYVDSNTEKKDVNILKNSSVEKDQLSTLTKGEMAAIKSYVSSEAYVINDALRRGNTLDERLSNIVKNLDSALDKIPDTKGTFNRSLFFDSKEAYDSFISSLSQEVIDFEAYTSVSKDIYDKDDSIRLIMNVKHAKDISSINKAEQELIIKRNTKFKILKRYYVNGKLFIDMEEL